MMHNKISVSRVAARISRKEDAIARLVVCVGTAALVIACAFGPFANSVRPAWADTSSQVQAEADAAQAKLDAMQSQLDQASNNYYQALDDHDNAVAAEQQAQATISSTQQKLGERADSMYKDGPLSFLSVLLGSSSFEQFSNNWATLSKLNEQDAALVEQSKQAKEEAAQQEQAAQAALDTATQVKQQAEDTAAQYQQEVDSLSAEAATLLQQEQDAANQAAAAAAGSSYSSNGNGGGTWATAGPSDGTVVGTAYACLGCEYVWGAAGPNTFDCSGLVQYCYGQAGIYVPHYTVSIMNSFPQVSDPQPGDICVNSEHCGIYIGGGQMINAATEGVGVIISGVQSGMIYVRP
jgi:cell wall-associated NlpC family hydrolase